MSDKINTDKIPEAEISLEQELSQQTETKTASNNVSTAWNFDEEINDEPVNTSQKTETKTPPEAETKKISESKITDKAKRASARTAVNMINFVQSGLFPPILNYKFQKKFTDAEKEVLDKVIDADKKDLDSEDLRIRTKFDRLIKAHNKKINDVPFNETEISDMEESFFALFDLKETTLSPEWFVYMNLINTLGKRAIDVFTK